MSVDEGSDDLITRGAGPLEAGALFNAELDEVGLDNSGGNADPENGLRSKGGSRDELDERF